MKTYFIRYKTKWNGSVMELCTVREFNFSKMSARDILDHVKDILDATEIINLNEI